MTDFNIFTLLVIRKRNGRSRGKHKNGDLKRKRKKKQNYLDTSSTVSPSVCLDNICLGLGS